jgi:hypothetical protein
VRVRSRGPEITGQLLKAERLVELSRGLVLPSVVRLDESLLIPIEERLDWERRLNRHLEPCGCAEGAVGLFAGAALSLALYLAQNTPWTRWDVAAAVALPLSLLVGGKTAGRRLGRLRFRRVCRDLLSRLAEGVAVPGGNLAVPDQ